MRNQGVELASLAETNGLGFKMADKAVYKEKNHWLMSVKSMVLKKRYLNMSGRFFFTNLTVQELLRLINKWRNTGQMFGLSMQWVIIYNMISNYGHSSIYCITTHFQDTHLRNYGPIYYLPIGPGLIRLISKALVIKLIKWAISIISGWKKKESYCVFFKRVFTW